MKPIHTERLVFRQYVKCSADRNELVSLFTDAEVMKYVDDGVASEEKANESFNRIFTNVYEMSAFDIWCVFTRTGSEYVCHAELKPRKATEDWEIRFILKKEYWENGYATEIANALVEHPFVEKGLKRVIATADTENNELIRVLEKIGMTSESTEKDGHNNVHIFTINKP
jgi:RimJ/RimL family protein N-acetyltransferase